MIEPDVVFAKVGNIQNCLRRIREVTGLDPERLDTMDGQDLFVLNLQRAVQSAIELCAHIIAADGLGLPGTLKENFSLLEKAGIIPLPLTMRLIGMVGFRNIAIHDYQDLKVDVLKSILTKNLGDLEEFIRAILQHYKL
jgi:uncharacterized protein YutE (UPF0331/DUF86 family)